MYIYIYIHICLSLLYIYIYRERDICIYIYIYMDTHTHTHGGRLRTGASPGKCSGWVSRRESFGRSGVVCLEFTLPQSYISKGI